MAGKSLKQYTENTIADGDYSVKIIDIELKDSRGGNPMLFFKGSIKGGEADGKKVSYIRPLSKGALGILASDIMNAGVDCEDVDGDELFSDHRMLAQELQGMVGKVYDFTVSTRTYEGRANNDFRLKGPATDDDVLELGMAPADV